MATVSALVLKRAAVKRKITHLFSRADKDKSSDILHSCSENVRELLLNIDDYNEKINDLYTQSSKTEADLSEDFLAELDKQSDYALDIKAQLSALNVKKPQTGIALRSNCDMKLPELNCPIFSGEESNDLEFFTFLNQFQNVVGLRSNLADSTKLTYLKSYLSGYALKVVQHLAITDENYPVALELLKIEFLNTNSIVDELYKKLLNIKPKIDDNFKGTKICINEFRCILSDLKNYKRDLLGDENSKEFVGHILFNKLPIAFRKELIRKIDNGYPSIDDIFSNYVEVVHTLNLHTSKPYQKPNFKPDFVKSKTFENKIASASALEPKKPVLQNSATISKVSSSVSSDKKKHCKFCNLDGHTNFTCRKFNSHEARVKRCKALGICARCMSSTHDESSCSVELHYPCHICQSQSHISALCGQWKPKTLSNFCVNASNLVSNLLLPIITILVNFGGVTAEVDCLIDCGSQRSYLATSVAKRLNLDLCKTQTNYLVETFMNSVSTPFSEIALSTRLNENQNFRFVNFLFSDKYNLNLHIKDISTVINNLKTKYNLAKENFSSENIRLEGLLGVDCIQYFSNFHIIKCMNGTAFKFWNKIVPFGNTDSFLTPDQLSNGLENENRRGPLNLNFALTDYLDPIGGILCESNLNHYMDSMSSLETLGIKDGYALTDDDYIKSFESKIQLIDNRYYVELPWIPEKICDVKSNFSVCKSILERVYSDLSRKGLVREYAKIFEQYLTDGIIEKVSWEDVDFKSQVFIPHRPVIKNEQNVTTKIRIVLNASLKIDQSPSLNEAAFPGVDLLGSLFSLLIMIRSNSYLVISDIKQAFLQIRLLKEFDMNKFSVLWKDESGNLIIFRYKCVVFGFVTSPFILSSVIRHHIKSFPRDDCSETLLNNIYVDNVFMTGNCQSYLESLYETAYDRMMQGGFELRSWVSNGGSLQAVFERDNRSVDHDSLVEKLLGYAYNPNLDIIQISPNCFDFNAFNTKRSVLSNLAKVFDPLGLITPLISKGKALMRVIWQQKFDWDDILPQEMVESWEKLFADLCLVQNLEFCRQAYNTENETELLIFSDSSQHMYGFATYIRNINGNSVETNLLFSKARLAPLKTKSLPTLELLGVFLAFKCLDSLLESIRANIKQIYICVDAQIVLSWILSGKVKTKNIFANNRIKDIYRFRQELESKFDVTFNFRYVPSEFNSADLLTRGLTFTEFMKKFDFWIHGPDFVRERQMIWPRENLGCLSAESKSLTCVTVTKNMEQPLLCLEKYSSYNKLILTTYYILKFIALKISKTYDRDGCRSEAIRYWIKFEQNFHFPEELDFLRNPSKLYKSNLIKNLNLFIDEYDVMRSAGRISKSERFSYDIANPIVLSRHSKFTILLIWKFHEQCKHLGTSSTLYCLRNHGFWIPKGRQIIKSILKTCIVCQKINCQPFRYPKRTEFISDRVNFIKPFNFTGIDLTGHFFVKFGTTTVKMYILCFTCLNIRALHLELLPSMTCESILMAFTRFAGIYCIPSIVYSDNASSFLKTLKILAESFNDNSFESYLQKNDIKHHTIPLYASWAGAAWERMIRTLKSCLYKSLGKRKIEYFHLLTLLSEIKDAINNRPLTYQDSDNDLSAITPNDFLKVSPNKSLVLSTSQDLVSPSHKDLVENLELREKLFDSFKEKWFTEYLTSLREFDRDLHEKNWSNRISIGDIVLIGSETTIKPFWHMACVIAVIPGADDRIRTVKVRKSDGTEGIYPINLLYPLELSLSDVSRVGREDERMTSIESSESQSLPNPRPQRAAAVLCRKRLAEGCN